MQQALAERTIILIPTFNEVENIGLTLEKVAAANSEFYVMVIDDNSPDGTASVVEKLRIKYPRLELLNRTRDPGFAQSYIDGFRRVMNDPKFDVVVMMDADFSHDPRELPKMLRILQAGADVVTGSRYVVKQAFPGISPWRKLLSRFANAYVRLVLDLPITDCTSGYVMLRRPVLRQLRLSEVHSEGYGFLFQLKHRLNQLGLKIVEHPVKWPDRHQGSSKMNTRRILESALLPWKIKLTHLKIRASSLKTDNLKGR